MVRGSEIGRDVRSLGGAGGSVRERQSHGVFFFCYDEDTQACVNCEGCGTRLELESNGVFELLAADRSFNSPTFGIRETTARLSDCHQR